MKRVSKALGSIVAVGIVITAMSTSSSSAAGDESLLSVSCSGGAATVTPSKPWHVNKEAPWKWDKGKFDKDGSSDTAAKLKGDKCEGTIKAFICDGDKCKGPIAVAVK
jgi:hypothetical protein